MSSGTVTFAGTTIMTAALGVFEFQPGMFERKKSYPFLPRAGVLVKDLGRGAAPHTLKLTYLNVLEGAIAGKFSALEALYDPVNTPPAMGRLIVQTTAGQYRNLPNCVVDKVEAGPMQRRAMDITPDDPNGTECYDLEFTISFVQTRR
jgi:hypothetical protein